MTVLERFWAKVKKGRPDECWDWLAAKTGSHSAYGAFYFDGRQGLAHRFAYAQFIASIPEGICVCHHCDNPACVNPAHLFLATQAGNLRDMDAKGRRCRTGVKGERNGLAKLSVEKVLAIRALRGKKFQREIAEMFGVSRPTIKDVQVRRTWAWVP